MSVMKQTDTRTPGASLPSTRHVAPPSGAAAGQGVLAQHLILLLCRSTIQHKFVCQGQGGGAGARTRRKISNRAARVRCQHMPSTANVSGCKEHQVLLPPMKNQQVQDPSTCMQHQTTTPKRTCVVRQPLVANPAWVHRTPRVWLQVLPLVANAVGVG